MHEEGIDLVWASSGEVEDPQREREDAAPPLSFMCMRYRVAYVRDGQDQEDLRGKQVGA